MSCERHAKVADEVDMEKKLLELQKVSAFTMDQVKVTSVCAIRIGLSVPRPCDYSLQQY